MSVISLRLKDREIKRMALRGKVWVKNSSHSSLNGVFKGFAAFT